VDYETGEGTERGRGVLIDVSLSRGISFEPVGLRCIDALSGECRINGITRGFL